MRRRILPTLKHHTINKDWPTIADLNRSLLLKLPDLDKSLLLLGRGSLNAKEFEDAKRTLSIACLLYPHHVDAHFYCGVAHLRSGDYTAAAHCLRRSLALDPASLRCKRDLADALARSAQSLPRDEQRAAIEQEALSLFLQVAAAQPSAEIILRAAGLALEQSQFAEALELFRAVVKAQPAHVPALTGMSRCLVGLQRASEAMSVAKHIVEIDPNNETALGQLRELRFINDNDDRAQQERRIAADALSSHVKHSHAPATKSRAQKSTSAEALSGGSDGARTRDLRRDRPAL